MSYHVQHICDQMTGFWDKLCDLASSKSLIYCSKYFQEICFWNFTSIKCNTWHFPNEVKGLFWRKAIDHSLTSGSTVPVAIVAKPGQMLEEKLEELIFLWQTGGSLTMVTRGVGFLTVRHLVTPQTPQATAGGWGWRAKRGVLILRNVTNVVPGAFLQIWRTASQSKLIKMLQRRLY